MGLFDKAESRVVRHTSGMNKNVRFNEYGKKIFNIPEKETYETIEEGLIKNFRENYKQLKQNQKDIRHIQPRLLEMIDKCDSVSKINYYKKDLELAKKQMKNKIDKCKDPEEKKNLQEHDKWLRTTYEKAIEKKKKELIKNGVGTVKENLDMDTVEEGLISKIIQGPETVKEELPEYEKKFREMNMQKTIKENTNRNFLQSLGNKTKLCVLENVLSSIYYDALYLDDDFKEYNKNIITESVHKFLDERGGYKYIQEAYYKNKSPLLKEIMRICEETSNEINKRKIEESKNAEDLGQNLFNFNMTSEEERKLDYSKEQIGLKQVSSVIKEKVLNVVKEEKKRESEHEELLSEIENELSENPDVNNPEAVAEALNKIFINNVNIEEGTLFNSLLRKGLKTVIESGYESLDLIKDISDEKLSDELDKVSLENILSEVEEHDYDDEEIYNDKMKELYDNMLEKIEEGKELGKNDSEAIVYAFDNLENNMDEIIESVLSLQELKDVKRDFRLIQEAVESYFSEEDEFEDIEEGCKGKCKKKCKKDDDDDEYEDDEYEDDDDDDDEECEESKCKKSKTKKKCKESCDDNIKTIDTTFENDIPEEINNKLVKECAIDVLENYINKLDEKICMHNEAKDFAEDMVYVKENGERYVIPIINKSDSGLNGLKLPYKMKAVLETLLNTVENFENCDNICAVKKVINLNKDNVNSILESYKNIPSTPVYKINYFNTFNELLDIIDKNVSDILESYNYISISDGEYDGGIIITDEDESFKMVTESIEDEFNPDDVNTIDMDYILADTIAKYTLMETMYTIKLEDYNYDSVRKMTNNMLNK